MKLSKAGKRHLEKLRKAEFEGGESEWKAKALKTPGINAAKNGAKYTYVSVQLA